jgi:hypothetical protein
MRNATPPLALNAIRSVASGFPKCNPAGAWRSTLIFIRRDSRNGWSCTFIYPHAHRTWSFTKKATTFTFTQKNVGALNINSKSTEVRKRMYKEWRDGVSMQYVTTDMPITGAQTGIPSNTTRQILLTIHYIGDMFRLTVYPSSGLTQTFERTLIITHV